MRQLPPLYKRGLLKFSAVAAIAVFSAGAGHAYDQFAPKGSTETQSAAISGSRSVPGNFTNLFSGAFVEAGVGYARGDANASNLGTIALSDNNLTVTMSRQIEGKSKSNALGRLGLGYGYMLPHDINLAGVVGYSTDQKLTGGIKLKNVFDVRFQPGYYIAPARTLVYTSLGYAWAKLQSDGARSWGFIGDDDLVSCRRPNGTTCVAGGGVLPPTVTPIREFKVNVGGLVLGLGAKYSPPLSALQNLYVGFDWSYTRYSSKNVEGDFTTAAGSWWSNSVSTRHWVQSVRPSTNDFLLTVGYRFF